MNIKLEIAKLTSIVPDKIYISIIYAFRMKKKMNWKNPQSFSEKLQWIKLYDRNPKYIKLVDKYEVKKYIDNKIGKGHTVPTLGIWERIEDINFSSLPEQFVIKGTHDSASIIICKDKKSFDVEKAKEKLRKSLNNNLYFLSREWPYKYVSHRIIAEEYLVPKDENEFIEYKLFCFDGKVKMVLVCKGAAHSTHRTNDFCNIDLERYPFTSLFPNSKGNLVKPSNYEKLLQYAATLSERFPEVRVDAYVYDDKIYFGELTFFHNSGLRRFKPDEWDYRIGSWISLPEKYKENKKIEY